MGLQINTLPTLGKVGNFQFVGFVPVLQVFPVLYNIKNLVLILRTPQGIFGKPSTYPIY